MTTKFTDRLRKALGRVAGSKGMSCQLTKTRCLYTPTYSQGKYVWIKLMDSDGTLVRERSVHPAQNDGAAPDQEAKLLLGVILQSEDSTSQTKPNPLGKASLSHVPNGAWVDTSAGGRRRLDHFVVIFVLPKGTAPAHRKRFEVSRRNVLNAATVMPDAVAVEVGRGESEESIASVLSNELRPFLIGKGRPKSEG